MIWNNYKLLGVLKYANLYFQKKDREEKISLCPQTNDYLETMLLGQIPTIFWCP